MALTLAQQYISLGLSAPLAKEFATQIETKSFNWKRLMWLGMVPQLAKYVAESLADGSFRPGKAMDLSMTEAVANLTYGIFPVLALGPSLLGYWDALNRIGIAYDSLQRVSSWKDKVAGYAAINSTDASKPVFSNFAFVGYPSLTFNGTQYLDFSPHSLPTGSLPCEIWVLVQQDAPPSDTTQRQIVDYGNSIGVCRRIARAVVSGVNRVRVTAGDGTSGVSVTGTSVDFSGRHVVRGIYGPSSVSVEVDRVTEGSSLVVPNTGAGRFRIGASASGVPAASNFWLGQGVVVMVTQPLSASQAGFLWDYLA